MFNKLSDFEKEAFISLSVFRGAKFGLDPGIAIVGGSKLHAKRNIESLKKKSLIDVNEDREMYAIHPLIQAFALEKEQNEMKNVVASSRARFLEYYINLFQRLNVCFLKGDSMAAFKAFYMEEQRILSSLTDGLNDNMLLEKVVEILGECEFFLDGLYPNSLGEIGLLYESALSKVSDLNFDKGFAWLYSSRQFFATAFVSKTFVAFPTEDDETSRKLSLLPSSVQGKLECYKGIYELSNGGGEPAARRIEDGLLKLDNNPQHDILKKLGFQFLAIYNKCTDNSVKYEQFFEKSVPLFRKPLENEKKLNDSCFSDQPLTAWAIARLSLWTRNYPWLKLGTEFCNTLDAFLQQICCKSSILVWTVELCTLLQLVDMAYIHLCISNPSSDITTIDGVEKSVENVEGRRIENIKDEEDARNRLFRLEREATYYHTLAVQRFGKGESILEFVLKELKIRQQLPQDSKLAECCKLVGNEQNSKRQYVSAVDSYKSALQILQKLHGEMHVEVATSYYNIAVVQDNMGDSESSLESYLCALKLSLKLFGGHHPLTIMIQDRINYHPFCLCGEAKRNIAEKR